MGRALKVEQWEVNRAKELKAQGLSNTLIAKRLGRGVSTIRAILNQSS